MLLACEVGQAAMRSQAAQELLSVFVRFDAVLASAVATLDASFTPDAAMQPFGGLHIAPQDVAMCLSQPPGACWADASEASSGRNFLGDSIRDLAGFRNLAEAFELSDFDLGVLLIALAPEVDLKYERIFAYLQDDVTRRRPTIDLALKLLCTSAEDKIQRLSHFDQASPLIRFELVHLLADPNQCQPPLLAHYIRIDERIAKYILSGNISGPGVQAVCHRRDGDVEQNSWGALENEERLIAARIHGALSSQMALHLLFWGPEGSGRRAAAERVCQHVKAPLLRLDMKSAAGSDLGPVRLVRLAARQAMLQKAVLLLDEVDCLADQTPQLLRQVYDCLADMPGIFILTACDKRVLPEGCASPIIPVAFPAPDRPARKQAWAVNLERARVSLSDNEIGFLAEHFQLGGSQVEDAIRCAMHQSLSHSDAGDHEPSERAAGDVAFTAIVAAARERAGADLTRLARKIEPRRTWGDIILPEDSISQLNELCAWVKWRQRVLQEWGFEQKLSRGKGVNALFFGPPGTGKTLAAEILAHELERDLFEIDLAEVVSKYIGETEKNLARIFAAAEGSGAVLFFDEADALFGKRSEVRDAHDRYANIEIAYLLQRIEAYEGLCILATNARRNLDEAFTRRIAFCVHFPMPDEAERLRIWRGIWPANTPLAGDLDFPYLARHFVLPGGSVKNIALSASFLGASNGQVVTMHHLIAALRRELRKSGKTCNDTDFGPYAALLDAPASDTVREDALQ